MSDTTFDPKAIFENYRNAFAPVLKAQQEGVRALDRVGRYQYDVAGDYLEWGLAQAKAALTAHTPSEFVSKQVELTTALSEKLRARAQEFAALATDAQSSFVEMTKESAAKVAAQTSNAAAQTSNAAAQTSNAAARTSSAAVQPSNVGAQASKAAAETKRKVS